MFSNWMSSGNMAHSNTVKFALHKVAQFLSVIFFEDFPPAFSDKHL